MLEGKCEKLEFQKMLSSPHRNIKMSKNKTKMIKKKGNQEKLRIKGKREEREMNEKTMKNNLS